MDVSESTHTERVWQTTYTEIHSKGPIQCGICLCRLGFMKSIGASYTHICTHMHIFVFFYTVGCFRIPLYGGLLKSLGLGLCRYRRGFTKPSTKEGGFAHIRDFAHTFVQGIA